MSIELITSACTILSCPTKISQNSTLVYFVNSAFHIETAFFKNFRVLDKKHVNLTIFSLARSSFLTEKITMPPEVFDIYNLCFLVIIRYFSSSFIENPVVQIKQ